MSVTIINTKDAIAIVDNAQRVAPQVTKSFFDVFGTTGCLLNCEDKKTLEQNIQHNKTKYDKTDRKGVRLARKEFLTRCHESCQEWFTASEITASAAQGCGSCSALRQIIQNLFSGN
jgi:hypothetical protein